MNESSRYSVGLTVPLAPPTSRPATRGALTSRPRISVVIPTLNEAKNLPHVLPRLPEIVDEVVLVDGRSTDDTVEVARRLRPDIRVVMEKRKGKGVALRSGFETATGDIIVMLDADGSTDPEEIPAFVEALLRGADFAKGSRFLNGAGTSDMEFYRKLGNSIFVSLVRILFGGKYTDLCYGYNAFWAHALPKLDLDVDGFEVETCMNIRALTADLSITEVSSFEYERIYGTSNLRTIPDGWRVLKTIFREYRAHMTRRLERLTLRKPSSVPMGSDETVMAALQFTLNEALYLMLHGSREMSPATCYTSLTALRATFETLMQQAVPSDVSAAEFGRAVQEAQRELNVRFSFEVSAGSAADQTEPPHLSDAYLSLPSQSAG